MRRLHYAVLAVCAGLAVSCTNKEDDTVDSDTVTDEISSSVRADLRLKRWRQVSRDLEYAMALPPESVCNEMGLYACSNLHAVRLGGTSWENAIYRSVDTPGSTTGLAMERMVLFACTERLRLDIEGPAQVYTKLDLASTTIDEEGARAQTVELYRRLLGRDPLQEEENAVWGLHESVSAEDGGAAEWALMACFAIGTTTEALMY